MTAERGIPPCDLAIIIVVITLVAFFAGCPFYARAAGAEAAMSYYRSGHPNCEACGKKPTLLRRIEVHHIKPPQHAFPALDADLSNLISLCRPDHIAYGHAGDGSCRVYVENIREVLALRKIKENK